MTLTKCRQVVDALLTAGYLPTIGRQGDEYIVRVTDNEGVNVNIVKQFADNQGVTATAQSVFYT